MHERLHMRRARSQRCKNSVVEDKADRNERPETRLACLIPSCGNYPVQDQRGNQARTERYQPVDKRAGLGRRGQQLQEQRIDEDQQYEEKREPGTAGHRAVSR